MRSASSTPPAPAAKRRAAPCASCTGTACRAPEAIALALEALVDAADIDVGTSGPDLGRGIYPLVKTITRGGTAGVTDEELAAVSERLLSVLKG